MDIKIDIAELDAALPAEYDDIYSNDPNRWNMVHLDQARFNMISKHVKKADVLDVGCGTGHTLHFFHKRWGDDVKYYGIDLSSVAAKLTMENVPTAQAMAGNITECTLSDIGLIILAGTAEHFTDLEKCFAAVRGILADDGLVYLEIPNCMGYHHAPKEPGFYRIQQGSRQMEWHYPRDAWESMIKKFGFEMVDRLVGPYIFNEFIWILKKSKENRDG